jgi:hypothetical protein
MARQGGGPGGCIVSILVIMVFLATFGLIEWDSVGTFAILILTFVLVSVAMTVGSLVLGYLSEK